MKIGPEAVTTKRPNRVSHRLQQKKAAVDIKKTKKYYVVWFIPGGCKWHMFAAENVG